MGFLKKLFGKSEPSAPVIEIEKDKVPVFPMIKDARWQGTPHAVHLPFVRFGDTLDLAIVFAQDAGDNFEYITPKDLEDPAVKANYEKWQQNIDDYPFEFVKPEQANGRIIVAEGEDHASEKMLSPAFLAAACKELNTDKIIISAPRRRHMAITSYYEDFLMLEYYFHRHFIAWRENTYHEEITEMVFVADAGRVRFAVPLGFRINLYEKDGQFKLSYSSMDELFDENGQINFQQIMEKNKLPVVF